MIINKITVKDFFRYYGEQTIEYTNKNGKNILVLIGENGRGKTTLLSAFSWALYGELKEPLTIEKMLNENKLKQLKILEETEAFVEIEFIDEGIKYIIKRSQKFIKSKQSVINKVGNSNIEFTRIKEGKLPEQSSNSEAFINSMIPKSLSGFFFFDGERIDRLAKVDGKKEIKQAILDILGIETIEMAQKDLERVKRDLNQNIKRYSNSMKAKSLATDHDIYTRELLGKEKKVEQYKKELEACEEIIKNCARRLKESNIERVRKLEERGNYENNLISKSKVELLNLENEIKKHISEKYKYYLLSKHCTNVEVFLEERRAKGQLPSDIRYTFIEDLLSRKECICGCNLEPGTEHFKKVESLKENSGRLEYDEAYTNIKGLIDDAKRNKGESFKEVLEKFKIKRIELQNEIIDRENNALKVKKELANIEIEDVAKIENDREEANKKKIMLFEILMTLEKQIITLKSDISITERKLQDINKHLDVVKSINTKIEKLDKLIALNNEFKKFFTKLVREELDLKIKEVFSKITNKDYRVPILTEGFELKITSLLNEQPKEVVLSTGERQIASLSFIGALVSYAKENKDHEVLSKFCASEYPIVMDSPFGNLDHIHTQNIAQNIGHLASQVVIIVSQKQWRGNVENNIKEQVSDSYFMYDGNIDSITGGEYTQIRKEL